MPGPTVVDLGQRIAAAIEAHRLELVEFVDAELDRHDRLVVERIAVRNGASFITMNEAAPAPLCASCGRRSSAGLPRLSPP